MKQKRLDALPGGIPPIINAGESHMSLILLLDVSFSMESAPIDQLNTGLNRFKDEVCRVKPWILLVTDGMYKAFSRYTSKMNRSAPMFPWRGSSWTTASCVSIKRENALCKTKVFT